MFRFVKNLNAAIKEDRHTQWRSVTVAKRVFNWRVMPNHWTRFRKIAPHQRVLQIRSEDEQFNIQLGIASSNDSMRFGALVIVGNDFPAIEGIPRNRRIELAGSTSIRHGMIHDAIIQSVVQRCMFAGRKFAKSRPVDRNGFPELTIGQIKRLSELMSLSVDKPNTPTA